MKKIILILICLIMVGCTKYEEESILKELKRKYKEEFIVVSTADFGFIVAPKDVSNIKFKAYINENDCSYGKCAKLVDNYANSSLLTLKSKLRNIDENIIVENNNVIVEITTFDDAINKYNQVITEILNTAPFNKVMVEGIYVTMRCNEISGYHEIIKETLSKENNKLKNYNITKMKNDYQEFCLK